MLRFARAVSGMDGLQDGSADERSGGHPQEGQPADDAQGTRPGRSLEHVRSGGGGDGDDRAASEGLDQPRGDELVQALGESRQQRSESEHRERGEEQPARPPQVGQAAGQRHRDHVDQQIAVDDPGGLAQIRPMGHAWPGSGEGDGRDHQLEAGQEDTDSEHRKHQVRVAAAHGAEFMRPSTTGAVRRWTKPLPVRHSARRVPVPSPAHAGDSSIRTSPIEGRARIAEETDGTTNPEEPPSGRAARARRDCGRGLRLGRGPDPTTPTAATIGAATARPPSPSRVRPRRSPAAAASTPARRESTPGSATGRASPESPTMYRSPSTAPAPSSRQRRPQRRPAPLRRLPAAACMASRSSSGPERSSP